jgi:hypothetical protein
MTFVKGETPEGAKPFKQGETGNPNGRPKGKSFKTILEELLDLPAADRLKNLEDVKELLVDTGKLTNREILMARLMIRACEDADSKSMERLMNRVDGMPKEHKEITIIKPLIIDLDNDDPNIKNDGANILDTEAKGSV